MHEDSRLDAVQRRQLRVEEDPPAPEDDDGSRDTFCGNQRRGSVLRRGLPCPPRQVHPTGIGRFLAETAAATDGVGVPRFIEREFRDFLGCGALDRGFARVRCDTCRFERLVPFSCKARAVCPSCGGRRMAEQAAHLVDTVLPTVPVCQWVLTVPHRLRYRLAFDHALCRAVLGVFIRTVLGWYGRRGRRAGIPEGQSGTVTVVQRFGSGLELNVHFHTLGLDGVFAP
ncbi:MAG: transposase, partial [Deltaproteobacteria bacterium]